MQQPGITLDEGTTASRPAFSGVRCTNLSRMLVNRLAELAFFIWKRPIPGLRRRVYPHDGVC